MKVHTRSENETEVAAPPVAAIANHIAMLLRTGVECNSDQETVRRALESFARATEASRTGTSSF